MSSDFINPIGARVPRLNQTGQVTPQRAVSEAPKADTGNKVAAQGPAEGFAPTSEAKESISDSKAGEAKASEILGAWSLGQTGQVASAGSLAVTGASNTAVNTVHGVSGANGPKPGFTDATVYSSRPPQG